MHHIKIIFNLNPLSTNFTKWSNTLKQFIDKLPTDCLSVFNHFVGLALKGLTARKNFVFILQLRKLKPFLSIVIFQIGGKNCIMKN